MRKESHHGRSPTVCPRCLLAQ
ncbi:hypothetical protein J5F27_05925 [Schleiferilactobacillus harbinensis]|uniref:Zinc finger FPG/IleRS-type domain-containing protein n=1 Tax=Schleiferilactobacillus harbinensis TaxID=304207 RepID=A0A5P8M9D4_9LACO|nr:hypothetical protein [Schleiferilactobacillus harbinensis]QFR25140.1 hypothetical protein D1010_01745 [Schleiferilactobacillus harbinensis]